MSTTTAKRANGRTRRAPSRARLRRRRVGVLLFVVLAATAAAMTTMSPFVDKAVQEIALPLRHEDVIRQQAREKDLDPALIAAVIYAESRFRDGARSSAGAIGLMQLTPATAQDIARRSGGTRFVLEDLDTAQVNISYGSWYLRYLLDRYGGNTALALAAYNGGEGNADRWLAEAAAEDRPLRARDIPYPETRAYVTRVQQARREYRRQYSRELGLR